MQRKPFRSALLAVALCHPAAPWRFPMVMVEMVEGVCAACHGVNLIERTGYTRDEWPFLASTMIDLFGNPELEAEIPDYLARQSGSDARRRGTDGPVRRMEGAPFGPALA